MTQFSYKAVDNAGQTSTGKIESVDRKIAVAVLAKSGRFVTEISEGLGGKTQVQDLSESFSFGSSKMSSKELLAFTSQFNAALRAGLPLLHALEILEKQQTKPANKKLLAELAKAVSSGKSLSEAMAAHSKIFEPLYISMIRVGETGGMLEQTTTQLVKILAREEKIKTSMRNASAYPLFVLTVGFLAVIIILVWVLPGILSTMGKEVILPLPTRMLLGIGDFIKNYGIFAAILCVAGFSGIVKWKNTTGRLAWDSFKLRIPILGSVLLTIAVGRFAKTLGALTKGGVSILESLAIVRDTLGNELLGRDIDETAEQVKAGKTLAEPLSSSGHFPPLLVQIVSIGEQTGALDDLLLGAADTFDEEADSAINKFIAIFPALMILLLALVIGFIIAATLMPIVLMELGGGGIS